MSTTAHTILLIHLMLKFCPLNYKLKKGQHTKWVGLFKNTI